MDSLPDITDPQRQACEKWEVQFDTDHVEIFNFAIRYATSSRSSVTSIGTVALDVTISTTFSQKRSTRSLPTDLPRQTSQLDLHIQKQMLELEVKLQQSKIQMEANATSVTETLSKALKGMGEQLGKLIDCSHVTSTEIAANTPLVKDSRKTLHDMDQKIETVKLDLNAQIDGLRTEIGVSKEHLRTIQEQVIDQGACIPSRPQTLSARQDVSARSTMKSLEATVLHRRTLLDPNTSSREQPSRSLPIMHPACNPSIGDDTSSDTSSEHQPANVSSNPSHGCCCSRQRTPSFTIQPFDGNPNNYARFKAKFRALFENEFDGSPAPLFMLGELLSKEVRNEISECLADETMYSMVWDRLDAVYDRTEVMDQTYLDDLLQIPSLKSQDDASLKTFANRLYGAVVILSQSRYVHEFHSRTTLMTIEAKLTTYLQEKWNEKRKKAGAELNVLDLDDWKPVKRPNASYTSTIGYVSTEEGSKVMPSSPPLAAPMGRRPKTEEKAAEKTDQWRCAGSRHHLLLHGSEFIPLRKQNGSSTSISVYIDCIPWDNNPEGNGKSTCSFQDRAYGTSWFEVKHAYAVDNLKVTPNPPINPRQMESWTHLRGLDVPNVQPEDVDVLIGLDVAEAHDHMDSVKPPAGTIGAIAFKTPFGWCLGGQRARHKMDVRSSPI
ncbi:hypothetical protein OUZ56_026370 [Daphnia magna]|uniref:Uncharacterized protein n=1 Tax=Daphnia magna TaxID=35525 RepID=A0ABQ9ZLK7_9CRUS|nr:hypothetical protein OUZ56_026370 [Daphnia magna]